MKFKKTVLWIIAVILVGGIAAAACFWMVTQKKDPYDEIIAGLKTGQAYAFADISTEHEALLVTDGVFENGDGTMAAIDATIYGYDAEGKIIEYGTVMSEGTAYPLAVKEGYLYFGGNHHMGKEYLDESISSVMTKEDATEVFDADAKATYYYFSLDDKFEGEVKDDSHLLSLFEEYGEAKAVGFKMVK